MTDRKLTDVPASVRRRLLNLSKATGEDFQHTLSNYAVERLLVRLVRSEHAAQFVLKGAQLFRIWLDAPHRPTRDLDLLRIGSSDIEVLESVLRNLCETAVDPPDGISFDPVTVHGEAIREDGVYQGVRLKVEFALSGAMDVLQIDVGVGDAPEPAPREVGIVPVLGGPAVWILAYEKETVIAEKLEAMIVLGIRNSRMKDFYDIRELSRRFEFDGAQLARSIQATFQRRRTPIPTVSPLALTAKFANDPAKEQQWLGFLRRSRLDTANNDLGSVVAELNAFLTPPLDAIKTRNNPSLNWIPGAGWRDAPAE